MTDKKTVGIRLTPEQHEKLKRLAEREHRTVSNLTRVAVEKYLQEHGEA